MNVETCVAPAENFLHIGKADELFPEKQGEDLVGEDFLDSQDNARPPPGLPDGNTRTPFQNDPHILEGTARNNKKAPDKKQCVPVKDVIKC